MTKILAKNLYDRDGGPLYTIEGEPGSALDRVAAAMEWLVSPATSSIAKYHDSIGEDLLHAADKTCGRSVKIVLSSDDVFHYDSDKNAVIVNPDYLQECCYESIEGKTYTQSLEVALAHELAHAADGPMDIEDWGKVFLSKLSAQAGLYETAEGKAANLHEKWAHNTPYYAIANHHINKLVENHLPFEKARHQTLSLEKNYVTYVEQYENPAIEIERKVARLRGEPLRKDYFTDFLAPWAYRRNVEKDCNIEDKLGIPPLAHPASANPDFWQKAVKNPEKLKLSKWEPNAHEHPLIATHQDGGRTD